MPTRFNRMPSALLQQLGASSNLEDFEKFLKQQQWPVPQSLRQTHNTSMYPVGVAAQGLDLMLQCLNPQATEQEVLWGIHSLTLHTVHSDAANYWKQAWPAGIVPETAKAGDIVSILAEDNDDNVLFTDHMACFEVPGIHDEQRWLVTALCDSSSKHLLTFSLIRNSAWRPLHSSVLHDEAKSISASS